MTFELGTEVHRYRAKSMPETATFLAKYGGTEVHKSKPTRESIIFDQVHKYRGTELEILTYFLEFSKYL